MFVVFDNANHMINKRKSDIDGLSYKKAKTYAEGAESTHIQRFVFQLTAEENHCC